MKAGPTLVIVVLLVVIGVVLVYLQINNKASQGYPISPGSIPTSGLACAYNLFGQQSMLLNASEMGVYNVSGYPDYVLAPGGEGNISFNVSHPIIPGFNESTINMTNSMTFYHTENASLINYSAGSATQSCNVYNNGSTICSGTLPVACYLGNAGDIVCQQQYAACFGTGSIVNINVTNQNSTELIASYNYTCGTNYSPPQTVTLNLNTHPGVTVSTSPENESLAYGASINGTLDLSAAADAPQGTYLASFNPSFCGQSDYVLITIGTSPYTGTIPMQAVPLTAAVRKVP